MKSTKERVEVATFKLACTQSSPPPSPPEILNGVNMPASHFLHIFILYFVILGMDPRTLGTAEQCSTSELHF